MQRCLTPALIALALTGCTTTPSKSTNLAYAQLANADGRPVGTATITRSRGETLPPFTSAGPHFNPAGHKHGLEAKEGSHAGDMPNLHIPPSGELVIEIANPMVTLAKGQPNSLFDADGSAIVIHAGVDDYKSDPAGNAGDRIICGVIAE